MTRVIFYCDESGAKGYANSEETYPGEIGVFAGIMLEEEMLKVVGPSFDTVARRYTPASGKLHITDLSAEQQHNLRQELYAAIRAHKLPCFWYAIHVAGLYARHLAQEKGDKYALEATRLARAGAEERIKRGSPRDNPASMHVELFAGLHAHLVAFLMEKGKHAVDVEIRTDQVDTPIVKRFREVAEELLRDDPAAKVVTGFDTIERKVVTGSVTITVRWPPDLILAPVVNSLSIAQLPESDGLVVAADVLANSLNFLFKNRDTESLYGPLNRPEAIADHPLADHLDVFSDWGTAGDLIGDGIYRHPKAKS